MGPKGMPRDIVVNLDRAVQEAMNEPGIRVKLESRGVRFGSSTSEQFEAFVHTELDKYRKLVTQLHISAD
jgi:tripartite-type tricarboxylate transporter receptor subunit TctC